MRGSENVFFLLFVIYFAFFNKLLCDFLVLFVGEVVGLVVVLICEVFWLKTKGWKVCWFVKVWCCFVLDGLCWFGCFGVVCWIVCCGCFGEGPKAGSAQ